MAKKVLIAEDEKAIAGALENKLKSSGFEVSVAGNGEEALNLLKENQFELLLLDLMMPKVDGYAVLESMQKEGNKTPVIVLSNLGQEEEIQKAKSFGAKDYFVKSNTPIAEIVEHINKVLGI